MITPRATILAGTGVLVLLAAAPPTPATRGEVVVHNQSFSSLEISVLAGSRESGIGSAPPEFSNTLYFPLPVDDRSLRFRARLVGAREVLYESPPLVARADMRVRWTLPANRLEPLRERASRPATR